jgi:hypothetical protein
MENTLRRIFPRVGINKSVSYNGLDVHSNVIDRYMGVALNISQNGIQLETDRMIEAAHILLMFFDYQSNYAAAKGKVVYSKQDESGKFKIGINLQGSPPKNLQFIKKLIKSYHYQKKVPIFIS